MDNILYFVGVDASKRKLDVFCTQDGNRGDYRIFSNDEAAIASLFEWLGARALTARILVEATSRYHRLFAEKAAEAGAAIEVFNPAQARALATGLKIIDKDDKTDARVLAKAAMKVEPANQEMLDKAHQELRDLSRAINELKQSAGEMIKRTEGLPADSPARKLFTDAAQALRQQARKAEKDWQARALLHKEIWRRFTLAQSVPCVGKVTARTVAVELPANLDNFSIRQLCAYSGVVPRRSQSGDKKSPDHISKSANLKIRTGVYMAATQAALLRKTQAAFYDKLIQKGLEHNQAIVAVIHKLLRNVYAVIKRNEAWTNEPPPRKTGSAPDHMLVCPRI